MSRFFRLPLAVLLPAAIFLAVPAFAQENANSETPKKEKKSEVVLKLEVAPSGQINAHGSITSAAGTASYDGQQEAENTGLYLAAEYYYYPFKFLGVGAGFKQQFDRHIRYFGDLSISNAYISVKPKLYLNPPAGEGCTESVYLIFQGGYGAINKAIELTNSSGGSFSVTTDSGFYYAGGIGFGVDNFVFELLFATNKFKIKGMDESSGTLDSEYTTTNISAGYRFGF